MLPISTLIRNRPPVFLLDSTLSVLEAARYMRAHRIGGAPVMRDGHLAGYCSERDLVFRVLAEGRDAATTRVVDIMSEVVVSATVDATVEECEEKMRRAHIRHLPILDHGKVVTSISLRDLLSTELQSSELEVRWLKEYVHGSG